MYEIRYDDRFQGWTILKDGQMVTKLVYRDEWEALDDLRDIDPAAAEELKWVFSGY